MLINLLDIWHHFSSSKETEYNQYLQSILSNSLSIDDRFIQSSFEFTAPIKVIFVNSIDPLIPADRYDFLPDFFLTKEEQDILDNYLLTLQKNPRFQNGDHVLLKNILFDTEKNELYLEAVKVKYAFLATMQARKFPTESRLYQLKLYRTGVIAPFITPDNYTALMRRNDTYHLLSAASGFLQPEGKEKLLNFPDGSKDLVTHTAQKEAVEEFLGMASGELRVKIKAPHITGLSFRESKDTPLNTIEFIAPIELIDCDRGKLIRILQTNEAEDKSEHTGEFEVIPLDPEKRKESVNFLTARKLGKILYDPILLATSRLVTSRIDNKECFSDFIPCFLPGSRTSALPVDIFKPRPSVLFTKQERRENKIKNALPSEALNSFQSSRKVNKPF